MSPGPARLKAFSNRAHARKRAAERYGFELTDEVIREWEGAILNDRAGAVMLSPRHGKRNRVLYAVEHGGRHLPVVFDAATASVVTLLPERALDYYRATLDPPASPPAVAPPAPEPEPFTPRIVGFMTLPRSGALRGLPDLIDPPEGAGLIEIDEAIAAVEARQAAVVARMASGRGAARAHGALAAEEARLGPIRRRLRAARHRLNARREASKAGVDPTEPLAVLEALARSVHSIGNRLGWDVFTQAEHDARHAAVYCLSYHGLAGRDHAGITAAEESAEKGGTP